MGDKSSRNARSRPARVILLKMKIDILMLALFKVKKRQISCNINKSKEV